MTKVARNAVADIHVAHSCFEYAFMFSITEVNGVLFVLLRNFSLF